MPLVRHRLYIAMVHQSAGGAEAVNMLITWVKSAHGWRSAQPRLSPEDIMLDDSHPAVVADVGKWSEQTHEVL